MTLKIGLGIAAALFFPGGVAAGQVPDSLTVQQAIQRVIATHPAVAEAAHGVAASEARVRVGETAFGPSVAVQGSYTRIGPTPPLSFGGATFNLYPADNWNGHVSVRQTLLDWGRRRTVVDAARSQQTSAAESAEVVKSRLAYQTVQAFYGVLFLRADLKVRDDEIDALTRHLEITQRKVAAGTATDFDVLSTQVRIATARSQRVDVTDALAQQNIELRQLLGLPADSSITPAGGFDVSPMGLNQDSLVQVALVQRPDLKMSRDVVASAEVQARLASLADRPTVSLDLSGGAKNGYVPDLNQMKANFVAGISVELPIYNGHRTRFQVGEAEANTAVARSRAQVLERSVSADVQRAVAAVGASLEKIATAEVQVRQARAAVALARTRYQAGVVTNLDVLDAETLLSEAELVQLRARYALVQGHYQLEQAVGVRIW
jgi:outer membrane protein